MKVSFFASAAALCLLSATQAGAATQLIDSNGKLAGATGVVVKGQSYDVTFVDGTCASVYGACSQENFDFTDSTSAAAAAQALLDQVFPGFYDDEPSQTLGCQDASNCTSFIAYTVTDGFIETSYSSNNRFERGDFAAYALITPNLDTSDANFGGPARNFARFSVAAAVPEPATWAMMMVGFGMVAGAARYRRRTTATTFA